MLVEKRAYITTIKVILCRRKYFEPEPQEIIRIFEYTIHHTPSTSNIHVVHFEDKEGITPRIITTFATIIGITIDIQFVTCLAISET